MDILGQIDIEAFSTWLEIDLGAIKNNLKILETISNKPIMPVVKANAYGHGLVEVSRAAVSAGATWLAVARIEEALALRKAGIATRILVLGYTPPRRIADAIREQITLTIYDREVAQAYNDAAISERGRIVVHVKVDSGMGRLGLFVNESAAFMAWLNTLPGLKVEAIFTHFARADEPSLDTTNEQIGRFNLLLSELEKNNLRPGLVHAANSAGTLNFPNGHFDIVRCGIVFYGLQPSPQTPVPEGFKPALSWKSHLTSVKVLPPGHGVSYNFHYFTKTHERIGVIAAGYADGFRRRAGNFALVRGKRVPVVGAVCMDQSMLQLDSVPEAQIGDEVVLIGRQGDQSITADQLAADWGTINYEVLCGLADRIPRIFFE